MKYVVWTLFIAPLVLFCVIGLTDGLGFVGERFAAAPPLVVGDDAPKLEDKKPEPAPFDPWAPPAGPVANNEACLCCHANFEKEPLVTVHAKQNIGCVKCHGKSEEHLEDEDNAIPPTTMFARGAIDKACEKCHDSHDVPAHKVVARWRELFPGETDVKQAVCTDCHGKHKLKRRTVRWNKKTRELIINEVKKPECKNTNKSEEAKDM